MLGLAALAYSGVFSLPDSKANFFLFNSFSCVRGRKNCEGQPFVGTFVGQQPFVGQQSERRANGVCDYECVCLNRLV